MNTVDRVRDKILKIIDALPAVSKSIYFEAVDDFIKATEFHVAFRDLLLIIVVEKVPVPPRAAMLIRAFYINAGMEDDPVVQRYIASASFTSPD